MRELERNILGLLTDRFHWASLSYEHEQVIRDRVSVKLTELEQRGDLIDEKIFKVIAAYVGKQIDFFSILYKKELVDSFYDIPYNVRMRFTSTLREMVEPSRTLTEKQKNDITRASARNLIQIFKEEKDEEELKRSIPQIIEGQINVQSLNTIK